MEKNLYSILEVNETSTDDEIKKSYKNLARKYLPDLNKDKNAEEKFKEINSAYEILGDKTKRKEYDLKKGNPFNFSGKKDFNFDFSDLFKDSFGGGFKKNYEEDLDIDITLEITEEMAIYGGKEKIKIGYEEITITIPSGITDGEILRIIGKGKSKSYKTGDLYIHIKIKKENHKTYSYDDVYSNNKLDLTINFDLPLKTAMFGGKVDINA